MMITQHPELETETRVFVGITASAVKRVVLDLLPLLITYF
jgi:hypothetical protein